MMSLEAIEHAATKIAATETAAPGPMIWNLVTDSDAGTFSEIYFTEAERDARCLALCADHWVAQDGPMSADWSVAYAVMQGRSCDWWFHLSEHDISDHPFVLQVANLLDRDDIHITSEAGEAIEEILAGVGSIVEPQDTPPPSLTPMIDTIDLQLVGEYRTRADLMDHPAFAHLETDSDGNPCVWENEYSCPCSADPATAWESAWSCQCDDKCPVCGKSISPFNSDWIAAGGDACVGNAPYDIWVSLPEAGAA